MHKDSGDSSDDHTTPDGPQNMYKLINRSQKGSWEPLLAALKDEDIALIKDLKTVLNCVYPKKQRDNLTEEERKAISYLKNAPELIVKPADKGSGTVIWTKNQYIQEANRQLNSDSCLTLPECTLEEVNHKLQDHLYDLERRELITQMDIDAMLQSNPREANFYLLPKIHKSITKPPGRPIMSGNGHPTEWMSA